MCKAQWLSAHKVNQQIPGQPLVCRLGCQFIYKPIQSSLQAHGDLVVWQVQADSTVATFNELNPGVALLPGDRILQVRARIYLSTLALHLAVFIACLSPSLSVPSSAPS